MVDRREGTSGIFERVKFGWAVLVAMLMFGLGGLTSYNSNDKAMSNRVTTLEAQQAAADKREQSFHEATDRRFVELRDQLREVNGQLRELVTMELQRAREARTR